MSLYATDTIVRGQSGLGTFPVVKQEDISVGYIVEADLTALQNIPSWRRRSKMKGFAITQNKTYELQSDLTTWTDVTVTVPGNIVLSTDLFDINGYIKPSLIQSIYATQSFVAASQAAMLALTTLTGNIVVRTDTGHVFLKLNNAFPSLITDFADITANTGAVTSVNGMTGAVTVTIAGLLAVPQNVTDFNTQVAAAPSTAANTSAISTLQGQMTALQAYVPTHIGTVPLAAGAQTPIVGDIGKALVWNGTSYSLAAVGGGGGSFTLIDGRGTTANGSAVDLGGIVATDAFIKANTTTGALRIMAHNDGATNLGIVRIGSSAGGLTYDSYFEFGAGALQYNDTLGGGIQYGADYSASYTNRSLVDKGYVASLTGATGAWKLASGGVLTANNTLSGAFAVDFNTISRLSITQSLQTSAWSKAFNVTPGNHTGMTLSTEFLGINTNVAASSQQWATGALTTQRWNYLGVPTIRFVGASTLSDGYNLYVEAPVAGTNATITRPWGIATNGNFAVEAQGKIVFNTGGNQIGMSYVGGVFRVGWISSGGGNQVDFVDNGTSTTMARFIGGGAGASSFAFNTTTTTNATFYVSQPALGAAWKPTMRTDPGAHTGITASTELIAYDNQGATQQWATGTLTTQRWNYFRGFTAAFVGASTLTNAYTAYFEAPIAGTNATITNSYSLGVAGTAYVFNTTASATSMVLDANNGAASVWMRFTTGQRAAEYGRFQVGGNSVDYIGGQFRMNFTGVNSNWTQSNNPTGWEPAFTWQAGTHTGMTASTEKPMFTVGTVTNQWATGALALQRNFWIKAPTYAFVGASTLADAHNLYVETPIAGTNATVTRSWSIGTNGNININNASGVLAIGDPTSFVQGLKVSGTGIGIGSVTSGGSGFIVDFLDAVTTPFARFQGNGGTGGSFAFNSTTITNATFYVIQPGLASAWKPIVRLDPGTHTAMTTATEFLNTDFRGATWTWASGTVPVQRFNYFKGFTVAGTTPTATFTQAATVYIDDPVVGTNAAITSNFALVVNGGMQVQRNAPQVLLKSLNDAPSAYVFLTSTGASAGAVTSTISSGEVALYAPAGYFTRMYANNVIALAITTGGNVSIGGGTSNTARLYVQQPALASVWVPAFKVDPGAHVGMTAATEFVSNDYTGATQQWATGTVALQRFNFMRGFTVAAVGASTFTKVFTAYVAGSTAGTNATITNNYSFGAGDTASANGFYVSADGFTMGPISHNNTTFGTSAVMPSLIYTMRLAVDQNISGITTGVAFQVNPLAYTNSAASTERFDNYFNSARTVQFATGTLTTQRFNYFAGATVGFVGASTLTNGYTVYIDSPVAGTNATITNNYALGVAGSGIFTQTTGAPALRLVNTSNGGTSAVLDAQAVFASTMQYGGSGLVLTGGSGAAIGNVPMLKLVGGVLSAQTASTELTDAMFDFSRTVTWATGAITNQRSMWIKGMTAAFAASSTITDAYSLYVDPIIAGTNATITRTWGIGTTGNIISIGASNKIVTGSGGVERGFKTGGIGLQLGAIGAAGGSGTGGIDLMDNNGGVTYASLSPSTGGTTSFAFGSSTLTNASFYIVHAAQSSAWKPTLRLDPGAHTGMTLSTEFPNVVVNTVTQQWATGALTTQRSVWIKSPTWGFVGASTLTDAYNFYVDAPVAGTNATITRNWAVGVAGNIFVGTGTPTTASILAEFSSTSRGVVMPRVTNIASVTTPTDGMIAYDAATNKFNFRENSAWVQLSAGGSGLQTCDVTILNAACLTLNSAPVTLVSAPGAGKFIYIIGQPILKTVTGAGGFSTNNTLALYIGTQQMVNISNGFTAISGAGQTGYFNIAPTIASACLNTAVENGACTLTILTGNPTGCVGCSIHITFQYLIVTL